MAGEQSHINGLSFCETAPAGSLAPLSGTTVSTLELSPGHYRTSNRSRDIRECFYEKACHGGSDADRYCANGYKGPCECEIGQGVSEEQANMPSMVSRQRT